MQIIKKSARNLTERFIGSSFGQKCVVAAIALIISTSNVMAGSKGAAGFTKATQEVSSYQTPVSNLMKAIAAVIVLVGAFNVYFKMQNGDQDVKKTIMYLKAYKNKVVKSDIKESVYNCIIYYYNCFCLLLLFSFV